MSTVNPNGQPPKVAEIGSVPHSWEVASLGNFTTRVTYGFTNPMPTTSSGPFMITAKDVTGGRINYVTARHTSWEAYHSDLTDKSRPRVGDVLLTKDGSIGRVALCDCDDVCINQSVALLQPNRHIDSQFLKFLIECPHYQRRMEADSGGTTIKHIYVSRVVKMQLAVPCLPTQRKIASILTAYDDLIENNTRRIAILEEMAQAIYREWFVNFRFPGHENVKLVDSPLGQIPEEWSATKLGDEIELPYGKALKAADRKGGDVAVYGSGGIVGYHDKFLSEGPGIIVGRKGNVGSVFWSDIPFHPIDTAFYVKTELPLHYVYFNLLLSQQFLNSDAAVPGLNRNQAYSNPLTVPASGLLESFTQQIEPIFSLTRSLRSRNNNLRTTRDLLLPKLMSGKLDVEDLEIDVGGLSKQVRYEEPPILTEEDEQILDKIWDEAGREKQRATNERPTPIDELDTDLVMAEFRQESRKLGTTTRDELLKAVSQELGYQRLGSKIEDELKGHQRAAIRRKIIGANGDEVWPETPSMDDYGRDELIDTFKSVMRKNKEYERDEVIRSLANYLGFRRLTESVREPIKSAINGAIRRGVLSYDGELIWRED